MVELRSAKMDMRFPMNRTTGIENVTSVTFDLFGTLLTIDETRLPEIVVDGRPIRSLLAGPISRLRERAPKANLGEFLVGYSQASARAREAFEQGDDRELPPDWAFAQALQRLDSCDTELSASLASALTDATIEAAVQVPDTATVLHELRRRGYALGVISNFADAAGGERLLARIGLSHRFDAVVLSGDVSWRKPNARIFAAALRRLRLPPSAVIHVGDEPRADICGASRAGMGAIWINPERAPYKGDIPPLVSVTTLAELLTSGLLPGPSNSFNFNDDSGRLS